MWQYDQSSGQLTRNGVLIATGYSGNKRGKNNPALQGTRMVGPIPRGLWKLAGIADSPNTGPRTITLHAVDHNPSDDTEDGTGRGSFRIHGDSVRDPGNASHGCIILPRAVRERMWSSGDHDLTVVM